MTTAKQTVACNINFAKIILDLSSLNGLANELVQQQAVHSPRSELGRKQINLFINAMRMIN